MTGTKLATFFVFHVGFEVLERIFGEGLTVDLYRSRCDIFPEGGEQRGFVQAYIETVGRFDRRIIEDVASLEPCGGFGIFLCICNLRIRFGDGFRELFRIDLFDEDAVSLFLSLQREARKQQ